MGLIRTVINVRSLRRLGVILLAVTLLLAATGKSRRSKVLVKNGNFEKTPTEEGKIPNWHIHLTSITPIPEYTDPANKEGRTGKFTFKCGCGHIWGNIRPWAQLVCPKCNHMNIGLEDSADNYFANHKSVSLIKGKGGKGRAVGIDMSKSVGDNEGVRVISQIMKAKRGAGYEISFDAISFGPHLRVFVEGFRIEYDDQKSAQWAHSLPTKSNPYKQRYRLKRSFRKQVNAGTPTSWQRFSDKMVPRKRYEFDMMFVTLYAYMPGKAAYDNVRLRQLSKAEVEAYKREHPAKERRLR